LIEAQAGINRPSEDQTAHRGVVMNINRSGYGIRLTKDSLKLHGSSRKGSTSIPPKGIMELKRKVKAGFVFTPHKGKPNERNKE
jgi:hypothetical protein